MTYADYNKNIKGLSFSAMKRLVGKEMPDATKALEFGILFDNLVLTPELINYDGEGGEVEGVRFDHDDYQLAANMRHSIRGSAWWDVLDTSQKQKVFSNDLVMEYEGFKFKLTGKCKYDFHNGIASGGDLKSTEAKSKNQFMTAIEYFDYDAARAWYMDISGSKNDVILGVSKQKVNGKHPVFVIPISRSSEIYIRGRAKYVEMAFSYYSKFGGV